MSYNPQPIRFTPEERLMLQELARRLERNQTETVRILIREALAIIKEKDSREEKVDPLLRVSGPTQPRSAEQDSE